MGTSVFFRPSPPTPCCRGSLRLCHPLFLNNHGFSVYRQKLFALRDYDAYLRRSSFPSTRPSTIPPHQLPSPRLSPPKRYLPSSKQTCRKSTLIATAECNEEKLQLFIKAPSNNSDLQSPR